MAQEGFPRHNDELSEPDALFRRANASRPTDGGRLQRLDRAAGSLLPDGRGGRGGSPRRRGGHG
jgi:hypothetical protein